MIILLLIALTITAVLSLYIKNLLSAVIGLACFSLLSALTFYYLHAPDVAIAEAAVGGGVTTVVFIVVISRITK